MKTDTVYTILFNIFFNKKDIQFHLIGKINTIFSSIFCFQQGFDFTLIQIDLMFAKSTTKTGHESKKSHEIRSHKIMWYYPKMNNICFTLPDLENEFNSLFKACFSI